MKLDIKKLREGKYIGQELWVCDYRYNDFNNKPIRHVKPTKVKCLSNNETKNRIYYSECFFREGEKKSSLIKLFDNTGYRSFSGISLEVFTEEQECIEAYEIARKKIKKDFEKYKESTLNRLNLMEEKL